MRRRVDIAAGAGDTSVVASCGLPIEDVFDLLGKLAEEAEAEEEGWVEERASASRPAGPVFLLQHFKTLACYIILLSIVSTIFCKK